MAVGPRRPGNWWNEHVNCAIALWCDEATFRAVQACAEDRRAHTGTYNLITYNCLTFCDEALAAGGIHLLTESGRELHTIVPKDAFRDLDRVEGAHPFEAWKYWFPPRRAAVKRPAHHPGRPWSGQAVGISAAISAFIWYNLAFLEDGRPMMRGLPKVGGEVASGVGRLCGVKGHGRRPDEARELSGKRETRR